MEVIWMPIEKTGPPTKEDLVMGCVLHGLKNELGEEHIVERAVTLFGPGAEQKAREFIALAINQKGKGDSGGKRG
jgi:hypothetical protein